MPTLSHLKRSQRQDLVEAIRKHGGIQRLATKLGMWRQSKRKPKGYWNNFAIVRAEISVFVSHDNIYCLGLLMERYLVASLWDSWCDAFWSRVETSSSK